MSDKCSQETLHTLVSLINEAKSKYDKSTSIYNTCIKIENDKQACDIFKKDMEFERYNFDDFKIFQITYSIRILEDNCISVKRNRA
jgi:hypothetical protein